MFYGAAFLFSIALSLFAILDLFATDPARCRGLPKLIWIPVVIFIPTIGPLAWLLLGRPERVKPNPRDLGYRAEPTTRPKRPLGPDDDPRFLEMTGGPVRPAARPPARAPEPPKPPATKAENHSSGTAAPAHGVNELKAWEEDLVKREQELRRKLENRPPEG